MATKTKTKPTPQKPKTVAEQIAELVNNHIAVTDAILQTYSYATEADMETEIKTANENLRFALAELSEDEISFYDLLQKLKDHAGFDSQDVFDLVDLDDVHTEDRLKGLDYDDAVSWAVEKGFTGVDLQGSMVLRDKLETFLKTEIYPHYSDQERFILM
jgi:hypothetical protein